MLVSLGSPEKETWSNKYSERGIDLIGLQDTFWVIQHVGLVVSASSLSTAIVEGLWMLSHPSLCGIREASADVVACTAKVSSSSVRNVSSKTRIPQRSLLGISIDCICQ